MRYALDSRHIRIWGSLLVLGIGLIVVGCATEQPVPQGSNYPIEYGKPTTQSVIDVMNRVRGRLDDAVVIREIWATSRPMGGGPTTRVLILDPGKEKKFVPNAYPMGVAYAGMIAAGDATGDPRYDEFVDRIFTEIQSYLALGPGPAGGPATRPFRGLLHPMSLDDCGALSAAMIRARMHHIGPDMMDTIQRSADFISKKQYRLKDGTLARKRPVNQSIWADDMFMSVSSLSQMGALTGNPAYFDDACKQVLQIGGHLWVPEKNLFTHGWTGENPDDQPNYFWGRANGWCMMAMADLLEVLPADHPRRADVLKLFRAEAKGVASMQAGNGLWHNMLDRPDTFTETSCSGMFVYAIAKGVNHGWLNSTAYGPVALSGWEGLRTRVGADGRLSGVCIGTGFADDYPYYYARPETDDVHGYGPMLLAGSEIIHMLKNRDFTIQSTTRASGNITVVPRGE